MPLLLGASFGPKRQKKNKENQNQRKTTIISLKSFAWIRGSWNSVFFRAFCCRCFATKITNRVCHCGSWHDMCFLSFWIVRERIERRKKNVFKNWENFYCLTLLTKFCRAFWFRKHVASLLSITSGKNDVACYSAYVFFVSSKVVQPQKNQIKNVRNRKGSSRFLPFLFSVFPRTFFSHVVWLELFFGFSIFFPCEPVPNKACRPPSYPVLSFMNFPLSPNSFTSRGSYFQ